MDSITNIDLFNVDDFIQNYRDSLKRQYDAGKIALNQTRRNNMASIMSNANARGMTYSNFPARAKTQYDVQTHNPALTNLATSYQTGLDALRNKGTSLANSILKTQEAIADLDKYGLGSSSTTGSNLADILQALGLSGDNTNNGANADTTTTAGFSVLDSLKESAKDLIK